MTWRKSLLGSVLASVVALAACGGDGERRIGDPDAGTSPDAGTPPDAGIPPGPGPQESCTWTLTRVGGTVTGSCVGTLSYDPVRPLSSLEIAANSPAVIAVQLVLPEVLAPGSYSFGNSPLTGSVSVTDPTGVYTAIRSAGAAVQGSVTYDVLSVGNTSAGMALQGRIRAEAVQYPYLQNRAQLTIDFSGLLR